MSVLPAPDPVLEVPRIPLDALGALTPVGRAGGQGRVYAPEHPLAAAPTVVKLYRRAPPGTAVEVLTDMIAFASALPEGDRARLHALTAWPLAIVTGPADTAVGIVMRDLTPRFAVPFVMPSGRRVDVLLSLEHLLGDDRYLLARGLDIGLGTVMRLRVAERISRALAFLHHHGIVVGDIAPNNLLVSFGRIGAPVCFIDCDSMVFCGHQALPAVQTIDWQLPGAEAPGTRAADTYKLGLVVLRLLARSHDARTLHAHRRHVPEELREPLTRALSPEPGARPSAADWQRMLGAVSAAPGIAALYPGPPSRPLARPAPPPAPVAPAPVVAPAAAAWPARAHRSPARRSGFSGLAIAWVVIGAVLLTLLLARLFSDAIRASQPQSFSGGGGQSSQFVPQGGGGGGFNGGGGGPIVGQ